MCTKRDGSKCTGDNHDVNYQRSQKQVQGNENRTEFMYATIVGPYVIAVVGLVNELKLNGTYKF